jgi:hypothetical protein
VLIKLSFDVIIFSYYLQYHSKYKIFELEDFIFRSEKYLSLHDENSCEYFKIGNLFLVKICGKFQQFC